MKGKKFENSKHFFFLPFLVSSMNRVIRQSHFHYSPFTFFKQNNQINGPLFRLFSKTGILCDKQQNVGNIKLTKQESENKQPSYHL